MKFENIIKKISALFASFFLFFICAGIYLQAKGFVLTPDGNIVLINQAQANIKDASKITAMNDLTEKIDSNINVVLPKGPVLGEEKAPISIYEFSSFGCYHCANFHLSDLPNLKKDFIDSGKVKLIFASFPLDKKSMQAAMIGDCIPEDKFQDYAKAVFKNQREWALSFHSDRILSKYASLNGINEDKAIACMKNDDIAKEIISIRQEAIDKLKIQGTPALLIVTQEGKEVIHGTPSYNELKGLLEKRLASLTSK